MVATLATVLVSAVSWVLPAEAQGRAHGPVTSISQIPAPVVEALTALCAPCSFADIGARWEATDVITSSLPQRRLVRANHSGSEWTIEYEHGGRGRHSHTAIFSVVPAVHFVRGSCGSADRRECEW